ncbi:MAG: Crp/Fnr family transcriptional regulator [Thermodesulfobacteriota bacterium]
MSKSAFDDLFSEIANPEKKSLQQGELLFEQGNPATHIFIVQKGCVRLIRYTNEGYAVPIYTAYAEESFAEAAMFSDIYHCNAEAVLPSSVWCYSKEQVLEILHASPKKSDRFMALLTHQVRSLRSLLELRSIHSARERILQYLFLHADPQDLEIKRMGTYKDMAHELGLAHETFYRVLATLEKEGKIQRTSSTIKIIKPSLM